VANTARPLSKRLPGPACATDCSLDQQALGGSATRG
jgi:hypothetical protein